MEAARAWLARASAVACAVAHKPGTDLYIHTALPEATLMALQALVYLLVAAWIKLVVRPQRLGLPRLLASVPVLILDVTCPFFFSGVVPRTSAAFIFGWLHSFKVLAFCCGRAPLRVRGRPGPRRLHRPRLTWLCTSNTDSACLQDGMSVAQITAITMLPIFPKPGAHRAPARVHRGAPSPMPSPRPNAPRSASTRHTPAASRSLPARQPLCATCPLRAPQSSAARRGRRDGCRTPRARACSSRAAGWQSWVRSGACFPPSARLTPAEPPWPPPPWPCRRACRRAACPCATRSCRRATWPPAAGSCRRATWPSAAGSCRRATWPPAAGWLRRATWRGVRPCPRGPTRPPRGPVVNVSPLLL
jgi:hypothetical protein